LAHIEAGQIAEAKELLHTEESISLRLITPSSRQPPAPPNSPKMQSSQYAVPKSPSWEATSSAPRRGRTEFADVFDGVLATIDEFDYAQAERNAEELLREEEHEPSTPPKKGGKTKKKKKKREGEVLDNYFFSFWDLEEHQQDANLVRFLEQEHQVDWASTSAVRLRQLVLDAGQTGISERRMKRLKASVLGNEPKSPAVRTRLTFAQHEAKTDLHMEPLALPAPAVVIPTACKGTVELNEEEADEPGAGAREPPLEAGASRDFEDDEWEERSCSSCCIVCFDRPNTASLVHADWTAHKCVCEDCGDQLRQQQHDCPICRKGIIVVLKHVYESGTSM
jgi:hypothetical protein